MNRFLLNLRKVVTIATCLLASTVVFAQTTDVYVAGKEQTTAAIWKNGELQSLSDNGELLSVIVVGEDVYACGIDGEAAKVWKNGEELYTLNVTSGYLILAPTSIAVSGDDTYVTTYELTENFDFKGRFWKNGEEQSGFDDAVELRSVCVDGDDIYIAGKTSTHGTIWKNGTPLYTHESSSDGSFLSVIVGDDDVYYMGGDYGRYGKNPLIDNSIKREFLPKDTKGIGISIWKNGEILYPLAPQVFGAGLFFSNGIIYAAGQVPNEDGVPQATIWANGVATVLNETFSATSSVFVVGDDVYAAGFVGEFPELDAILWINGEANILATGGYNSANSVFVVQEGVGISKFENTDIEIYPNPTTNTLKIANDKLQINKTEIIDLSGKVIYQFNNGKNEINVSMLPQGVYFVKLETNKGVVTKKFVKE